MGADGICRPPYARLVRARSFPRMGGPGWYPGRPLLQAVVGRVRDQVLDESAATAERPPLIGSAVRWHPYRTRSHGLKRCANLPRQTPAPVLCSGVVDEMGWRLARGG